MKKDYYHILGISEDAHSKEIRTAYYKLSLRIHPDVNKNDKFFEEYSKQLNEAYEVLIDNDSRREYDQSKNKNRPGIDDQFLQDKIWELEANNLAIQKALDKSRNDKKKLNEDIRRLKNEIEVLKQNDATFKVDEYEQLLATLRKEGKHKTSLLNRYRVGAVIGIIVFLVVVLLLRRNNTDSNGIIDEEINLSTQGSQSETLIYDTPPIQKHEAVQLFEIEEIAFANTLGSSDSKDYSSNTFESSSIRYINPRLKIVEGAEGRMDLYVKFIRPDGTLFYGTTSPPGCSYYQEVEYDQTTIYIELMGFGVETISVFEVGIWTVEIWTTSERIGIGSFYVN